MFWMTCLVQFYIVPASSKDRLTAQAVIVPHIKQCNFAIILVSVHTVIISKCVANVIICISNIGSIQIFYWSFRIRHLPMVMILSFRTDRSAVWLNSVDPDQTAPAGAAWSGFTLFAILSASLDALLYGEIKFNFRIIAANFVCLNLSGFLRYILLSMLPILSSHPHSLPPVGRYWQY